MTSTDDFPCLPLPTPLGLAGLANAGASTARSGILNRKLAPGADVIIGVEEVENIPHRRRRAHRCGLPAPHAGAPGPELCAAGAIRPSSIGAGS